MQAKLGCRLQVGAHYPTRNPQLEPRNPQLRTSNLEHSPPSFRLIYISFSVTKNYISCSTSIIVVKFADYQNGRL